MGLQKTSIVAFAVLLSGGGLRAQNQFSLTVNSEMDIYRAGGFNDGSDGIAPIGFVFGAGSLSSVTFPSVTGTWTCQGGTPDYGPDGETSGYCLSAGGATNFGPTGPFSGYQTTDFVGAMVGVFLTNTLDTPAPATFRFYFADNAEGGIPTLFRTLTPAIGQVFFIGDGKTGTGTGGVQVFNVPLTATRLFLGYIDNCMNSKVPGCFGDNVGSVQAVIRLNRRSD